MKIADLAHAIFAASGDAKTVHLYAHGIHFDTLHKLAGDEYDSLSDDADLFAELALELGNDVANPNDAANAAQWSSLPAKPYDYEEGVLALVSVWLKVIRIAYAVNESYPKDLGVQNACQDFIQRAQKELRYRLKHRI
jgi:DNA-binding ferritin-like protein